jgi:mannose-6-phosphate isomerase-like protein (cupin superfamily)
MKQVLLANADTCSSITQIAVTTLRKGESVDIHVHETMDEHYMFYSGDGLMIADGNVIECHEGLFLLIPAGMPHELCALSDLKFMTIGVALGNRI